MRFLKCFSRLLCRNRRRRAAAADLCDNGAAVVFVPAERLVRHQRDGRRRRRHGRRVRRL